MPDLNKHPIVPNYLYINPVGNPVQKLTDPNVRDAQNAKSNILEHKFNEDQIKTYNYGGLNKSTYSPIITYDKPSNFIPVENFRRMNSISKQDISNATSGLLIDADAIKRRIAIALKHGNIDQAEYYLGRPLTLTEIQLKKIDYDKQLYFPKAAKPIQQLSPAVVTKTSVIREPILQLSRSEPVTELFGNIAKDEIEQKDGSKRAKLITEPTVNLYTSAPEKEVVKREKVKKEILIEPNIPKLEPVHDIVIPKLEPDVKRKIKTELLKAIASRKPHPSYMATRAKKEPESIKDENKFEYGPHGTSIQQIMQNMVKRGYPSTKEREALNELQSKYAAMPDKGKNEIWKDYLKNVATEFGPGGMLEGEGAPNRPGVRNNAKFGKYFLDLNKLDKNVLSLQSSKKRPINNLPNVKLTKNLRNNIIQIMNGISCDTSDLNPKETQLLDFIVKKCKIPVKNQISNKSDELLKRLEIITGSISAGNDSKLLKNELSQTLNKLHSSGVITTKQAKSATKKFIANV